MASNALTTAGRFLVRRERPNRPAVDNASRRSWCPRFGVRFTSLWNVSLRQGSLISADAIA
jgi:hypothetical protein